MAPNLVSPCTMSVSWHALSESDVCEKLATTQVGLSSQEAASRILEFGKNELPEAKKVSVISIFLSQFRSPLIYVLIAAALLSRFLDHLTDTAFIAAQILVNAIIGTIQEWKAE